MAFSYDPEIGAVLEAAAAAGAPPMPPANDPLAMRAGLDGVVEQMEAASVRAPDVSFETFQTTAPDGAVVRLRWYTKAGTSPGSAALYVHGGGMICGSIELYDKLVANYVSRTGVPLLSVAYRLAPEHPHPTPVEDCYAGLRWLADHAAELKVDPARIAVIGDSAGGGLAAGVALLARDRGLPLARQILIYPMLDDRNVTPDPNMVPFASWSYEYNLTGWKALMGARYGADDTPHSAAPARVADLHGVAPAYLEVGELDIFRDETIEYARRIAAAGVSIELHVHPGAPHGFERMATESDVAKRAMADRFRVLRLI